MQDDVKEHIKGHLLIRDKITGEVIIDKMNAINFENFSVALARTLSNRTDSWIQDMVFGNGAATVTGIGTVTYLPPNVVGSAAQLYNQTYYKCVNDQSPYNSDPTNNYMTVAHVTGTTYSDVIITCNLGVSEPSGQYAFDSATDLTTPYVFNEIGLKAYSSSGPGTGSLLTHVVFSPVQKSLNRQLEIVYTIRIQTV